MLCAESPLGIWLAANGGHFHPLLHFQPDGFGNSVYAKQTIPPTTNVVSCPFALAITPTLARTAVKALLGTTTTLERNSLIVLYLALHKIFPSGTTGIDGLELRHGPYIDSLPAESAIRTPLYFNEEETNFLRGTNLHGATVDRERDWSPEHKLLQDELNDGGVIEGELLTWNHFLYFSTILSSRAFPSSLIDGDKESATPILFPGVDMLNHRRGEKVSWISEVGVPSGLLHICLDNGVESGQQVFNNYGAKPNEELLLGYGFVTPNNASDVLALKLSLPSPPTNIFSSISPPQTDSGDPFIPIPELLFSLGAGDLRHFVPRTGILPPLLLAQLRLFLASPEERQTIERTISLTKSEERETVLNFVGWENEADVLAALEDMLESKLELVQSGESEGESAGIRSEVRDMIVEYRTGQVEILEAAIKHVEHLFESTIILARRAGVELGEPEDEGVREPLEGDGHSNSD